MLGFELLCSRTVHRNNERVQSEGESEMNAHKRKADEGQGKRLQYIDMIEIEGRSERD